MAAIEKGAEVHAKEHSSRCEAISEKTKMQCRAWAIRDKGTCFYHSLTPSERLSAARRGGLATSAKKRAAKAGNPRSGLQSHVRLEEVLRVCVNGMTATFTAQGLPSEPDWDARLLSLVVLLGIFGKQYRSRPDEAAALLLKVLPEQVRPTDDENELQRQIAAGYAQARKAWREERAGVAAIRGLFLAEEYPKSMIAEWEDKDALNAEFGVYMKEQEARLAEVEVSPLIGV